MEIVIYGVVILGLGRVCGVIYWARFVMLAAAHVGLDLARALAWAARFEILRR